MEMNSPEQKLERGETEQALCSGDTSRGVNYSLSYVFTVGGVTVFTKLLTAGL
jgi:hypothetical protein